MNNEWKRAVSLFKLCNNWDHAADILITKTAQNYLEHNSTWREVLSCIDEFDREIRCNSHKNVSLVNQHNLVVIQQMMTILDLSNNCEYYRNFIIERSFRRVYSCLIDN